MVVEANNTVNCLENMDSWKYIGIEILVLFKVGLHKVFLDLYKRKSYYICF